MLNTEKAIDSLVEKGWYEQRNVLSVDEVKALGKLCQNRTLVKAAIGKGDSRAINEGIRSDNISWLTDNETDKPVIEYQQVLDVFRQELNQSLYLGLSELECHFAQYPQGSFYKAHKDSFKETDRRSITFITYLNPDWKEGDGGELRLYLPEGVIDVNPYGGTVICFKSSEILHEVLMSNTERLSLTGWFLKRAV